MLLSAFVLSLLTSVLYYIIFSQFVYYGRDTELRRENRELREFISSTDEHLETLEGAVNSLYSRDRKIYKSIFDSYPIDKIISDSSKSNLSIEQLLTDAAEVRKMIDSIHSNLDYLENSASNIPSKIPIADFALSQIGASQGKKMNPFYKSIASHNGIDIIALTNTKVFSPADGIVTEVVNKENRGSGKMLTIDHQNGYKTRYANLNSINVAVGQRVKVGTKIATVGSSGMSFAPHLHYEVIFNGRYMNPVNYFFADISPEHFNRIVIMSENMGQSLD